MLCQIRDYSVQISPYRNVCSDGLLVTSPRSHQGSESDQSRAHRIKLRLSEIRIWLLTLAAEAAAETWTVT
jgi:hypothetical protein